MKTQETHSGKKFTNLENLANHYIAKNDEKAFECFLKNIGDKIVYLNAGPLGPFKICKRRTFKLLLDHLNEFEIG